MRLYEGTIEKFSSDILENSVADKIKKAYENYYHKHVNDSEYRSWQQSLNFLNNAFNISGLKKNPIIIEHELPYSSRRIDVLVFGSTLQKNESIVLVELKQWSNENVIDVETEGNILVNFGRFKEEKPHPSLQVQGYHFDLKDFLTIFSDKDAPQLDSCSYCHNYSRDQKPDVLFYPKFQNAIKEFPVFAKEDARALGEYFQKRLSGSAGLEVFNRFLVSPVRPSKTLLAHTRQMINEQQIFNLIDDQIAAYNAIMHKAINLTKTKKKSIVIVKGGPGTGKSVIALEVMGELLRKNKSVMHATGSSAFTNTLRKIVGIRAKRLFNFFNSFPSAEENAFDVLICDEAHRIRENSVNRYTSRDNRSGLPQIEELLKIAKLNIFFLDENQIVRPGEIGSVKLIKESARKFGVDESEIAEFELKTQFRCSGSDAYLDWIDDVLNIRKIESPRFDERMEFRIFDNPSKMREEIRKRNQEKPNSARIAAGFCWKWSAPRADGSLVNDVKIGDFEMPWEKKNEFWKWATDDSGMEQVGTVYTAQGFEFDYIGVIFGNDLIYDSNYNQWRAVSDNSYDSQVTRNNPDLVRHLLNTYRVLLSRAHKGVYIYFMDKDTEKYFKDRIGNNQEKEKINTIIKSPYVTKFGMINIPLYESVGCGEAMIANSDAQEMISIRKDSVPGGVKYFALKTRGDSMDKAGINSGDVVLCRKDYHPEEGNKVVAIMGEEAVIKKYHREGKFVFLEPCSTNPEHKSLKFTSNEEAKILGVFVRVLNKNEY